MITGLNHLTLSVTDLDRSFRFYTELMGAKPRALGHGRLPRARLAVDMEFFPDE